MINKNTIHLCLLSGGLDSALVALNVAAKYGTENMRLLNHNINNKKEVADIKRFKKEVADYLQLPITYANFKGILDDELIPNQFEICIAEGQITTPRGDHICTSRLKTKPFLKYLKDNFEHDKNVIIYYGFHKKESARVVRRSSIMGALGYVTAYPNFNWPKHDIKYTTSLQIGIKPPLTYDIWEHANCIGCLKAGLLHWYVVYCTDMDTYHQAIEMEESVGENGYTVHTIKENGIKIKITLRELMPLFCQIKALGVKPTEHQNKIKFGRALKRLGKSEDKIFKPCDCHI